MSVVLINLKFQSKATDAIVLQICPLLFYCRRSMIPLGPDFLPSEVVAYPQRIMGESGSLMLPGSCQHLWLAMPCAFLLHILSSKL